MEENRKYKTIKKFRTESGAFTLIKTKHPYQITRQELYEFADREISYKITEEELTDFSKAQRESEIRKAFSIFRNLTKEKVLERE